MDVPICPAHRYREGTNHARIPVNQPKNQVNNYSQDGEGRYLFNGDFVQAGALYRVLNLR